MRVLFYTAAAMFAIGAHAQTVGQVTTAPQPVADPLPVLEPPKVQNVSVTAPPAPPKEAVTGTAVKAPVVNTATTPVQAVQPAPQQIVGGKTTTPPKPSVDPVAPTLTAVATSMLASRS